MKHIVFIIFFLGIVIAFSQEYQYLPFPTENVIWSEVQGYGGEHPEKFTRHIITGENMYIDSTQYKKLYRFSGIDFNEDSAVWIGGIREDSFKRIYYRYVYAKKDSVVNIWKGDLILYDFNGGKGDSVFVSVMEAGVYKKLLIITNVDTVEIGGVLRRKLTLNGEDIFRPIEWIEGIGNINNGLLNNIPTQMMGIYDFFICLIKGGEVVYKNSSYKDCYPDLLSIEVPQEKKPHIHVYPNPTTHGTITFNLGDFPVQSIEIYTVEGILKDRILLQGRTGDFEYNLNSYKTGVYVHRIIGINGNVVEGKFIVE